MMAYRLISSLLTSCVVSGTFPLGAENSSQKACQCLERGFFSCVHAPEKHGVFTAIYGREWDNTKPFGGIFPPFCDGFRLAAFFASCGSLITEKITEASMFRIYTTSRFLRLRHRLLSHLSNLAGHTAATVALGALLVLPVLYFLGVSA